MNQAQSQSPSYYLMKNGFILRLEQPLQNNEDVSDLVKENLYDPSQPVLLNQEQANYRVAIFRDEILELDEYQERMHGKAYA